MNNSQIINKHLTRKLQRLSTYLFCCKLSKMNALPVKGQNMLKNHFNFNYFLIFRHLNNCERWKDNENEFLLAGE